MNPELQQLKDIHLPHAINMWPIAPGWIILFIIFLGLTSYLLYSGYQRNQKKKTVKFALTKLNQYKELIATNPQDINIAAEISMLIRRTALHYFRREDIAGLSGDNWLDFLNRSGDTTQFTGAVGRILIDAPYRNNDTTDLTPLFTLTLTWLMTISKKNILLAEK
jgi:hypothetical protein